MSTQATTRPRKPPKTLSIQGPFPPGRLVPMPPAPGARRPKAQRFLNYAVNAEGRSYGALFQLEVPDIQHYQELLQSGLIRLRPSSTAPAPAPQPAKKE